MFFDAALVKPQRPRARHLLTKHTSKRAVRRRASQNKSPINIGNPTAVTPLKFERTVEAAFDINCDGINPSVGIFNFSLNDLPSYTEFTVLFDLYKIERIEIEWYPEYTELSDAGLTSNAVNVQFNTAIDPAGNTPSVYTDVLQYRTLHSTGISKRHKRDFVPAYLLDGIVPAACYISTSSPSSNLWGVVYGVPATGTAMVFRSRAKFYLSMAQSK